MTAIRINLPPLARYQRDFIFCPDHGSIIEACTKSGKTIGCVWWLFEGAATAPVRGREFWWVAPIFEQAKIAFRRFVRLLRESDPTRALGWVVNRSDLSITLGNGSVVRFKSADKPDSLYGEDVYRAVIDESSRCKEEAYHAVRSTMTATEGQIRIIGNVKGRRNWAYTLARKAQGGHLTGWKYASITADDAVREKILTEAAVLRAKAELPHDVFMELFYNQPTEDGANPFGLDHIRACAQDELAPGPAVAFGVDLARKHDFTVVTGLNAEFKTCVFDRFNRLPWGEIVRRVVGHVGDTPALIDSTGVGDAVFEQIAKECPAAEPYVFTTKTKQAIMEREAVAIQAHETGIYGDAVPEFESFEYEVHRTYTAYSAPAGLFDDCVCSHGLALLKMGTNPGPVSVRVVISGEREELTEDEWDRRADEERAERENRFLTGADL